VTKLPFILPLVPVFFAGCDESSAASPTPHAAPSSDVVVAEPPAAAVVAPVDSRERRAATADVPIYREPAVGALRGLLAKGEAFPVVERVEGPDCAAGWARLDGDGYACLDHTEPSAAVPIVLPRLVAFDPPDPSEWTQYSAAKGYTRDNVAQSEALLPFIYGKPWRTWKGPLYADVAAFEAGAKPVGALTHDHKYHFSAAKETSAGTVLVRDDGQVSPVDSVFLYPVSRFHGRDLLAEPIEAGFVPGWAVDYDGGAVFAAPAPPAGTAPAALLELQKPLKVKATAATADGTWWEVEDALGPGIPGYMKDNADFPTIRRWELPVRPAEIGASERWIDVNIAQQVLTVMDGDTPIYTTLVSSGLTLLTPIGLFRISDKAAWADMEGRSDASYDPYFVENVPWVMHFAPRYALHGAFWHWGFGHRASHGCVNLAPQDAKWIFEHVGPSVHEGWLAAYETPADPGTAVRIRNGAITVRDRRVPLE
jgi:lipoprotein-anchoring transpeptidase ErfK/SrfK